MMKTLILSAILLCSLSSCTGFYQQVVQKQTNQLESLNLLFATIDSRESANAASGQITQFGNVFLSTIKEGVKSGRPSILDLLVIKNQLTNEKTKEVGMEFITQCIRLYRVNFYGSPALKEAVLAQFSPKA